MALRNSKWSGMMMYGLDGVGRVARSMRLGLLRRRIRPTTDRANNAEEWDACHNGTTLR